MKGAFQRGKVVTISIGHFSHDVYTSFLAPVLPLLIDKLGVSLAMAGILDVVRKVPALFNPLLGLLADRADVKYFVIMTPAVSSITMSLLGVAPTYFILLVLLFVTGISSTLFHIPSPVMIKNLAGKKTGTGMSYYMFGGELARSVGPLVITAAISLWGLEGSYRVMPFGIAASAVLYFKLRNVKPIHREESRPGDKSIGETLRNLAPFFIAIGGFLLFRAAMKSALTFYLPTYLTGQGNSLWIANAALSVMQFSGALGTFGSGHISDKISHKKVLIISGLLTPLAMLAFIYGDEMLVFPLLFILGLLLFASGPVMLALVQETNTRRPAFVNSIYMFISFGVSSLMVLFVGILGDNFGLEITFKVSAVFAFLSPVCLFMLPSNKTEK